MSAAPEILNCFEQMPGQPFDNCSSPDELEYGVHARV